MRSSDRNFLANMLGTWHREARFIDEMGRAKPLALEGVVNSLASPYAATKKTLSEFDVAMEESQAIRALFDRESLLEHGESTWVPKNVAFSVKSGKAVEILPQLNYLAVFAEATRF